MTRHTNRLAQEASPYLLQHAHNPVDWYPWGEEAFEKARRENKPVLVSIGYATCHWCHVMEKESFEDEATAAIMNEQLVCIKVDREERPDVDHVYMDAVIAMTGSGGWPLNVFLTPDKQPFYGGTYFPPRSMYNRPSWQQVVTGVAGMFREKYDEVQRQAGQLTDYLKNASVAGSIGADSEMPDESLLHQMKNSLLKQADTELGGFGGAPKFPQPLALQYLFEYGVTYQDEKALAQVALTLRKMTEGGINDQLRGGYARYSTDNEWLAPHFEKMLYDNALLLHLLAGMYVHTQEAWYATAIEQTIGWLKAEMTNADGLFYAAQDADSEGEEGRYYVWSLAEVQSLLGEDAALFSRKYDITEDGNWEGVNILRVMADDEVLAKEFKLAVAEVRTRLERAAALLLEVRSQRIPPLTDDKILTAWNTLMNTALVYCANALDRPEWLAMAQRNMDALLALMWKEGSLAHSYREGQYQHKVFLDDYAYTIRALHQLAAAGLEQYLPVAGEMIAVVMQQYREADDVLFSYTAINDTEMLVRKVETYDGALPSGNSVMAENLLTAGLFDYNDVWVQQAAHMLQYMAATASRYPLSHGLWGCVLLRHQRGLMMVKTSAAAEAVPALQAAVHPGVEWVLLHKKTDDETHTSPRYEVCAGQVCHPPVNTLQEALLLLRPQAATGGGTY